MIGTLKKIEDKWFVESTDNVEYQLLPTYNINYNEGLVVKYIIETIYAIYPSEKNEVFAKIIL